MLGRMTDHRPSNLDVDFLNLVLATLLDRLVILNVDIVSRAQINLIDQSSLLSLSGRLSSGLIGVSLVAISDVSRSSLSIDIIADGLLDVLLR